jgi:lysine N-acyltransferase
MTDAAYRLARERVDVRDEVKAVAPPPVPSLDAPYALRVAGPTDASLVAEWMNRPHLAAAWEYDWPVARWQSHIEAQLNGTYSLPLIGSWRGVARGYLELYRAAKDSISTRYESDPHDLGLHAAIADEPLVNRGFGPMLLPRIVASVFRAESHCTRIMFDPDYRNTTARRLCEFVGCTFLGEHDMANRRMALYALPRPIISS